MSNLPVLANFGNSNERNLQIQQMLKEDKEDLKQESTAYLNRLNRCLVISYSGDEELIKDYVESTGITKRELTSAAAKAEKLVDIPPEHLYYYSAKLIETLTKDKYKEILVELQTRTIELTELRRWKSAIDKANRKSHKKSHRITTATIAKKPIEITTTAWGDREIIATFPYEEVGIRFEALYKQKNMPLPLLISELLDSQEQNCKLINEKIHLENCLEEKESLIKELKQPNIRNVNPTYNLTSQSIR